MSEPNELSLTEAAAAVRTGKMTATELTEACLARIDATDAEVGAFASVQAEAARTTAAALDRQDPIGVLHGVPIALKDLFYTEGVATEANCAALAGFVPDRDATVVARLKAAGAIIVGKTNTHELAFGVSCPASRNPWSLEHMTGGSSGGSAAALAARQVPGAFGTDTGGSVRIPANYCGVTGIKTTLGAVPRDGVHLISWTYDTVGPMARTAEDCALLLEVAAGPSPRDHYSVAGPFTPPTDPSSLRLGVPAPEFFAGLDVDPAVQGVLDAAIEVLTGIVAGVKTVQPPTAAEHFDAGAAIVFAESAALMRDIRTRVPDRIGAEPRAIMDDGAKISAPDFAAANDARNSIKRRWERAFEDQEVDVIIAPITPNRVLDHGLDSIDGVPLIPATTQFTFPINGAGLPAIALPGGFDWDGLPVGFQLIGRAWYDLQLASLGRRFQTATEHHLQQPTL